MLGAEAELRLGELRFVKHEFDRAYEHARRALTKTKEPPLLYLASMIGGRALNSLGDTRGAARHYEMALEVIPNAQSATLALAALQTDAGDGAAALRRVALAHSASDPAARRDPWRLLCYGEYQLAAKVTVAGVMAPIL